MNEGPYEKLKREQEESEKSMARMREATWQMERDKKKDAEETAERRHRELVESMKKNTGIHINSGGDTNISRSNITGRDSKTEPKSDSPEKWYKKPVGIIIVGLSVATLGFLVRAALKHFYPIWFS
jgi:cytochrome c biogenesis factor